MSPLGVAPALTFAGAWGRAPLPASAVLEIAPGEIHLWRIDLDATDEAGLAALSAAEHQRAAGFLRAQDGRQFARSRAAVRAILARYLDIAPADVRFRSGRNGKPDVAAPDDRIGPSYNSTHSHRLALCAVAGVPVGVDVEWIRPAPIAAGIAAGIVSPSGPIRPDEIPSPELDWTFFQAWTRTEAALKATGEGLSALDRRHPDVIRALAERQPSRYHPNLRIGDVPISLDYAGAVAMLDADAIEVARCWTWDGAR